MMDNRLKHVIAEHDQAYGKDGTSGIISILINDNVGQTFTPEDWADWTFKPAPSAFVKAVVWGLLNVVSSETFSFTPLGLQAADHHRKIWLEN